jgi:hypothetical protein
LSYIGNPVNSTQFTTDNFTGDGSTNIFTLSRVPASVTAIGVFVDGVKKVSYTGTDYTLDGNLLTLVSTPTAGQKIEVVHYGITLTINQPADGTVTANSLAPSLKQVWADVFTANGTGNTFVLSYEPISANGVIVSANGVIQYDYSVSNTTLLLNFTPTDGTTIRAQAISSISYAVGTVVDNSISTSKIQNYAVTSTKMANTGVTSGSYGGTSGTSTVVPVVTVDAAGRITNASNTTINLSELANVSIGNVISSNTILTNSLTANTSVSTNTLSATGNTVFRSIKEHSNEISISTNTITLDLSQASVFNVYLNSSITGITVNNIAPAGLVSSWVLVITADGTPRTISWPGQYRWPTLNTPPSITSTADRKDTYAFLTFDGGSTILSYVVAQST